MSFLFLVSDDSEFVYFVVIKADGGWTAQDVAYAVPFLTSDESRFITDTGVCFAAG